MKYREAEEREYISTAHCIVYYGRLRHQPGSAVTQRCATGIACVRELFVYDSELWRGAKAVVLVHS